MTSASQGPKSSCPIFWLACSRGADPRLQLHECTHSTSARIASTSTSASTNGEMGRLTSTPGAAPKGRRAGARIPGARPKTAERNHPFSSTSSMMRRRALAWTRCRIGWLPQPPAGSARAAWRHSSASQPGAWAAALKVAITGHGTMLRGRGRGEEVRVWSPVPNRNPVVCLRVSWCTAHESRPHL